MRALSAALGVAVETGRDLAAVEFGSVPESGEKLRVLQRSDRGVKTRNPALGGVSSFRIHLPATGAGPLARRACTNPVFVHLRKPYRPRSA
jgi:hypothetical protein